jgi:putative transcriptional regulator
MSRTDIARVTVKRGEARTRGSTDWKRIDAMTDEEATANAPDDPDAQPLSEERLAKMRWVSRVKVLRQRLGMTQAEFAAAFHLPIGTLRDWEQHQSNPVGLCRRNLHETSGSEGDPCGRQANQTRAA